MSVAHKSGFLSALPSQKVSEEEPVYEFQKSERSFEGVKEIPHNWVVVWRGEF